MASSWLSSTSLAVKLRLTAMLTVVLVLATSGYLLWAQYQTGLTDLRQVKQAQVHSALVLLTALQQKAAKGEISEDQAKAQGKEALKHIRQGSDGYLFILDAQAHMVMHPVSPELDGKDLSGVKDTNGFPLFTALVTASKGSDGGTVRYSWLKPSTKQPAVKETYAAQFTPWGWTVGTGAYLEDMEAVFRQRALNYLPIPLAGALLLWLALGSMSRSITSRLATMRELANAIARGDISQPVHWHVNDEIGEVMSALKDMSTGLNKTVSQVRHSVDSMATASQEVAVGSADLSLRTEQTAARLQETASSVGLLHHAVQDNTQASRQANELASSARSTAQHGHKVVSQVVQTMEEIQTSARKITDIITVIDGIAFQTNILALNAAVEAARAGEQGRGFAVVASEVRALAGRSASAAREIKALIAHSSDRVESGSSLVQDAGTAMQAILQSVEQVDQTISRIAGGAHEQAEGIGNVNQAVTHLDSMTQQNAALVEQSAAAAASLQEQSIKLTQAVSWFKLAGH